jgi:hypothetical protein
MPARHELDDVRAVDVQSLGLAVRPVIPAFLDTFIPREAHPLQVFEDGALGLTRRPRSIGVFDAKEKGAARTAREQPVKERGARIADVQLTSRTRGETDSHGGHLWLN